MKSALYHIRTRCNYSQGMVARELGVSRQILSFWESGTKAIPKTRKTELAQLFGVPESILEENEESIVAAERHCRKTDGAVCRRQPRLFGASRIGLRSGRRPLLGEIKPLHHPGQFVPYGHQ